MREPDEEPQLPLTPLKSVLLATGIAIWMALCAGAYFIAPAVTGPGDTSARMLGLLWLTCVSGSTLAALLIVRQADLPDVATASFLVTIPVFAVFAVSAAIDVRDTPNEVNLVDTMFMGITSGALTALIVWAIAMGIARTLRLPTTAHLRDGNGGDAGGGA